MTFPHSFILSYVDGHCVNSAAKTDSREVHVDLAVDILLALYDEDRSGP